MIDINQLISFVIHTKSSVSFREVKKSLISVVQMFEGNDFAIIQTTEAEGLGEIIATIANSKNLTDNESFLNAIKDNYKTIGSIDIDCPKIVFAITDSSSQSLQQLTAQLKKTNALLRYNTKLHVIVLQKECDIEDFHSINIEELKGQVSLLLMGDGDGY